MNSTLPPPQIPHVNLPEPKPELPPVERSVAVRFVSVVLGAGFVVNLGIRVDRPALGGALALTAVMVAAAAAVTKRSRKAAPFFLTALACAVPLAFRSSPWLISLDVVASLIMTITGALAMAGGRPLRTLRSFFANLAPSMRHVGSGDARLGATTVAAMPRGVGRHLRVAAAAAPVVLLIGLLLMSADALFASFFHIPINAGGAFSHVVLTVVCALALTVVAAMSGWSGEVAARPTATATRPLETVATLWGVAILLGAFAITQLVAAIGGRSFVERRVNLTYKQYARQGFFQLLAVAAIVLILLAVTRRFLAVDNGPHHRSLLVLGCVVGTLVLVVVMVSIMRIRLYNDLGLTMLRLYSTVFAAWLGFVVLVALGSLRRPHATWVLTTIVASAVFGVLAMNIANPEALVVRYNLTRTTTPDREMHSEYMLRLSDDATPELVRLAADGARPEIIDELCRRTRRHDRSLLEWNHSSSAADDALAATCSS